VEAVMVVTLQKFTSLLSILVFLTALASNIQHTIYPNVSAPILIYAETVFLQLLLLEMMAFKTVHQLLTRSITSQNSTTYQVLIR